ncbi:MAG TPA: tripartite tricarboxylate transporter substrate-binding protein [Longimicrobiales bacterium]|nr:tripartite tricarboxylate transporter substrate-binding protein [Longimicrobiales bacterium]
MRPRTATPAILLVTMLAACLPDAGNRGWECIAPANAGGGWDRTCRSVGRVLGELGLASGSVRTTNLPGAGGGVAFAHAIAQRDDDPTLLVAASPGTTLLLAQGTWGDMTENDVRWLGAVGAEYGVLAVAQDAPWNTLNELLDAWRADPDGIVVSGGSAAAGQDHMKVLLLAHRAGIDPRSIRYVPFDGGGEAMTALLGGFVQVFSGEVSEILGQVQAGRMRPLTVLAPLRLGGVLTDVPTAKESGIDVEWITWRGFFVPGGISDARYEEWVRILTTLAASPEWEEARKVNRFEPFVMVGPEFDAFVKNQVNEFREMSREIGLIR